jgi:hypothetical protein
MRNKNMNRFFTIVLLIFASLFFSDCKRTSKDLEILGPEYKPAPPGFAILTGLGISNSYPNFNPGTVYFTAGFSHEVTWTLTITGKVSGAKKVFTGLSSSLDASNTLWDGGASTDYFFRNLEEVDAVLTILGSDLSSSLTVELVDVKPYNGYYGGVKYTLIENFENSPTTRYYNIASPYRDQGDDPVVNGYSTTIKVQGNRSWRFQGKDKNSNSWVAGVTTDSLNIDSAFRTSTVSPEDFYINLYVYGTGKPNSSIQVKAYEIDNWSSYTYKYVKYDQTINDGWVYDIMIDWTGWKLISIRYSNFKRAADPVYGGNGNGIRQPQNITGFGLGLNSVPNFGMDVEAYVDFMVVTEGGPFKP